MNPFSSFLRQWLADDDFDAFVAYWDRLERLTVQVYREKVPVAAAQPEFAEVWPWLRERYGRWQSTLEPFWRQTTAAGASTQTDPFLLLLQKQSSADIPGDWWAMQHLPAAREALNRYVLAQE
ncbi:MAG: hypothetical protein HND44_19525 [Chloroflexi bacterium]|nr:hypothetical protein [Ardenticatenaceae bacterium]MBL1130642.1 hypothetical protein [Chloroflexota bacterium]NOG36736.1 hypothetical protein [Chloroflexota bacterium]